VTTSTLSRHTRPTPQALAHDRTAGTARPVECSRRRLGQIDNRQPVDVHIEGNQNIHHRLSVSTPPTSCTHARPPVKSRMDATRPFPHSKGMGRPASSKVATKNPAHPGGNFSPACLQALAQDAGSRIQEDIPSRGRPRDRMLTTAASGFPGRLSTGVDAPSRTDSMTGRPGLSFTP
jgi:hypothetical protein